MPSRSKSTSESLAPEVLACPPDVPVRVDSAVVGPGSFYLRFGKRCVDVLLSLSSIIVLAPILLSIGVLVKLDSMGPVLFRQLRVGKDGRLFWILKFRSMVNGAERIGPGITAANDLRITRVGRFLRQWKLDELPQLWNVLKGEMSFVGPRPELPSYVAQYSDEQRAMLRMRPGITDAASIRYRDEELLLERSSNAEQFYCEKILPEKLTLNLKYLKDLSFAHDLSLLLFTLKSVARHSVPERKTDSSLPSHHGRESELQRRTKKIPT